MGTDPFNDRFVRAEDDLLLSLCGGHGPLVDYQASWSSLKNDFVHALTHVKLSDETITRAHIAASNVALIADCFSDLEHKFQNISVQFHSELDSILRGLEDLPRTPSASPVASLSPRKTDCASVTSTQCTENHFPSFIGPAYQWLLDNLHNPYPPSALKCSLAKSHGCSVNSINSWFANARRRMGWTSLCREEFRGCRSDMMDAAYRALVKVDSERPLPLHLSHAFVKMKVLVEEMYSTVFTRSAFAGELDSVVKDMTNGRRKSIVDENRNPSEMVGNAMQSRETHRPRNEVETMVFNPYLSPDRSSTPPLPPLDETLTDESEEEHQLLPAVVAGRKRCSFIEESSDPHFPEVGLRPLKRLRSNVFSGCTASATCLPSPPTSIDSFEDMSNVEPRISLVCSGAPHSPSKIATQSPKRSSCDINTHGILEQPHCTVTAPSLQTVSDHLVCSNVDGEPSIDEWFKNFDPLFAFPSPVDAVEPDSSIQWDVEFFGDYSMPPNLQKHPSKSPLPTTPDGQNSARGLEHILQCIEDGTFVAVSEIPSLPAATPRPGPHSLSSSDPSQTFNWTSLLNDTEILGCITNSMSPRCPQSLPDIELSMLQLPEAAPTVTGAISYDCSSRRAEICQSQLMQEAIQRMEDELQFQGVSL